MPRVRCTVEELLFLIQLYLKYECPEKCTRKFRCQFPGQSLASKVTQLGQSAENNGVADRQEARQENNCAGRREIGS
jgi:hypothetical protein